MEITRWELFAVVIGVVLLGIAIAIAAPYFSQQPPPVPTTIITTKTTIPVLPRPDFPGVLEVYRPISSSSPTFSPAEVGCSIAKDIALDISKYGIKGQREFCFLGTCIVSGGIFNLSSDWTPTAEQAAVLRNSLCTPCPSQFDEACISANLGGLNVSEIRLCGNFITSQSGDLVKFGNDQCAAFSSQTCSETCPGGDMVKDWKADSTSESEVSDSYTESALVQDGRLYSYLIYWDSSSKTYKLRFPRIPRAEQLGDFEANSLGELVGGVLKSTGRAEPAGAYTEGIREKKDFYFTPSTDISLLAFAQKVKEITKYDVKHRACTGEDCINVKPEGFFHRETPGVCTYDEPNHDDLNLYTDVADDGALKAGKKYRVVVRKWGIVAARETKDCTGACGGNPTCGACTGGDSCESECKPKRDCIWENWQDKGKITKENKLRDVSVSLFEVG